MKQRAMCLHCRRRLAVRPRKLCFPCHGTPGVRERYPVAASHHAKRGVGNHNHGRLPAEPTSAVPGSEEKIRILCERARRGESLFHPLDVHLDDLPSDVNRPLVRPAA